MQLNDNAIKSYARDRYPQLYEEMIRQDRTCVSFGYSLTDEAAQELEELRKWVQDEKSKLKPCPFCGESPDRDNAIVSVAYRLERLEKLWQVRCTESDCGMQTPEIWDKVRRDDIGVSLSVDGRQEVIDIWNRRASDDTDKA